MMRLSIMFREYILRDSPLRQLERFAIAQRPYVMATTLVRTYYFFLLFISIALFPWDPSISAQTDIVRPWSILWLHYVEFSDGYTFIRIFFMLASIFAAFATHLRIARIVSFIALFEFVSLYMSVLQLDVAGYGLILTSFFFMFLPARIGAAADTIDRMKYLLMYWAAIAVNLMTYTMVGIGKLHGAFWQFFEGQAHFFSPNAAALHIADRMLVTDTMTPLGLWAVAHPLIIWPYLLFTLYFTLLCFLVAFRPSVQPLWGLLLVLFHVGNYLTINIGFVTHLFLWPMLLMASPFAPEKIAWKDIVKNLPLLDIITRRLLR